MWKVLVLFLLFPLPATSQDIRLNDSTQIYYLVSGQVFYMEDDASTQSEMLALISANQLAELQAEANLGYKTGAYWLIRQIDNQSVQRAWTLHFGDTLVEKLDLYVIGKKVQHIKAYYSDLSPANRLLPTGSALKVNLQPGTQLLALRMDADVYDQTASIYLTPTQLFDDWAYKQIIFYLLVLGGIVGLSLYSLFLFVLTRDLTYGWYAAFSLLACLYIVTLYGYFYPLLGFEHINRTFDFILLLLSSILLLIFVHQLLVLRLLSVWFTRLYTVLGIGILFVILFSSFLSIDDIGRISHELVSLTMLIVIISSLAAIKKGQSVGWFVLLAWLPLVSIWYISIWLIEYSYVGAIGVNIELMSYVATFFQLFILLLAVVNKINVMQKHKLIAETQSREKSHFIAAASHDLRQPLHSMGLFISLLEQHVEQEGRNFYTHIKTSLATANNLFNSVLDLSRLEAGVIKPEITSIDVDKMMTILCKEFLPQAKNKGISLRYRACRRRVFSDIMLLERILRNLINNAIHHTQTGGVLIGSRLRGERLWLECWDTGQGIAENDLATIFMEFEQLNKKQQSKDTDKGLGLGLAIVKRFTHLLGIEVQVASRVQRGSVFRLSFSHDNSIIESDVASTFHGREETIKPINYSIWLLDNDDAILQAMDTTLSAWGCRVACAQNWTQLQKITQGYPGPDLFIVDLDLEADLNGFDVIEQFHRHFPDSKVVMITGNTDPETIQQASSARAQILYKPLNTIKLRYLLQRM